MPGRTAGWRRFNWELHSALGFWSFALILMWAMTGVVVSFPGPYTAIVDVLELPADFDPENPVFERRMGDRAFRWLTRAHFGTFGGWPIKALWAVLGLVPAALFVTGVVTWWMRVLRHSA